MGQNNIFSIIQLFAIPRGRIRSRNPGWIEFMAIMLRFKRLYREVQFLAEPPEKFSKLEVTCRPLAPVQFMIRDCILLFQVKNVMYCVYIVTRRLLAIV